MAAVLACGEGAVISHRTAAELHGILGDMYGRAGSAARAKGRVREAAEPEVTVPSGRAPAPAGVTVHRRRLEPEDLTAHRHIPVTTVLRTLLDLATVFDEEPLSAAVNAADRLQLADPDSLRAYADRRRGQRGVAALRRLLDPTTFVRTDSTLERRFLPIVRDAGLPRPATGARLNGYRVDFHWPELRLVVETDGLRYHRTAEQQARDRRRDQVLAAAGFTVLRFTGEQVAQHADEVVLTLRAVSWRLRRAATPRRTRGRSR